MQKLSIQLRNRAADLWIRNSLIASATIDFIADDRMLEPGEVHANLMRASGLQLNVKQRKPIEAFSISVQRQGDPASADDRHACSVARIAGNRLIDFAAPVFDLSMHQCDVGFENFPCAKLIR